MTNPTADELVAHSRFVHVLARSLMFDQHEAADVAQDALVIALENSGATRRSTRAWLAGVVRNRARVSMRSRQRRKSRELQSATSGVVPAAAEALARLEIQQRLVNAVRQLDKDYRTIIVLRFFDGLPPRRIARRLGLPVETVKSRQKRGLALLRGTLDRVFGDRRAWCLALLPLAFANAPASAAVSALAVGVTVMTAKKRLLLTAALLVALFGTVYVGRSMLRDDARETERATGVRSTAEPDSSSSPGALAERPLATGGTLRVIVRNLVGEPLEGADVVVRRAVAGNPMGMPISIPNEKQARRWIEQSQPLTSEVASATTDHDGRAELRSLPGGEWDVLASRAGYASRSVFWRTTPSRLRRPLEILLGPARRLAGRVVDEEGKPVAHAIVLAGAAVRARQPEWGPWPARVVADDEGRYEFSALFAEDLSLWAAYPESVARFVAIVRTPGPQHFDITLQAGGVVEGTVTVAGKPVADALVVVTDLKEHGSAVTDRQGHYRIEHMPEVSIAKIDVSKKGLAQVFKSLRRQNRRVSRHNPVRIDVEMVPGASICGRVLGPDGPIPGASAGCSTIRADFGHFHRSVVADENGRFRLDDLPPDRHLLRGYARNHTQPDVPRLRSREQLTNASEKRPFIVDLKPGEEIERDIQLVRGPVTVEGWVEGPEGKPFEGAQVYGGSGWSGPDGRFLLHLQPKALDYPVSVYADGYVQVGPKPRIAGDTVGLHLRLRRASTIIGTVRNEAGQTVAGAYVMYDRGAFVQLARKAYLNRLWYLARGAPVGKDGSFKIDVLGPFDIYLRAEAPGYSPSIPVQFSGAKETTTRHEVALVLRAAHRLRGSVTCGGEPVAGAHVRLRGPTWQKPRFGQDYSPTSAIVAVTDAAGRFETEVGAGSWVAVASAAGYTDVSVSVRVPGEEARLEVERRLSIEGRVVFADGKPAVGAWIYCSLPFDEKGMALPNRGGSKSAQLADAQGRFVLRDLDPGLYRLNISATAAANVVSKKVEPIKAGARDLRIVVQRGHEITGRLVDENGNGLPKVGVSVRGHQDTSIHSSDQTDTKGYFRVRGLPNGLYTMKFTKQDEARSEFKRRRVLAGTKDLVVAWGHEEELDAANRMRAIGGVVVDEAGRPIARVYVSAKTSLNAVGVRRARTDARGRFLIENLKPGRYTIQVRHSYASDLGTLSTGTLDARLVVVLGATIQGIVRDEKGNAIRRATVRAYTQGGTRRGKSGADGAFTVKGLPAQGRCDLSVWAPGYAITVRKGVQIGAAKVVLLLRRGIEVSGTLKDSAGTPLAGTTLHLRHTSDSRLSVDTHTDEGARFRVRNLNPGRYDVYAVVGNKDRKCGTIDAGATGIALVVSD